jgi:patatin-like phospholipase/acyl hydrolase
MIHVHALVDYIRAVILTFDMVHKQALNDVSKNALLADVCISTSAAPTYLPGHHFETKNKDGKPRAFNLIDGGVAANNPVSHSFYQI